MVKIYFLQETQIQVHQTKVTPCLDNFPAGYYWNGQKLHSPGWPPQWLEAQLDEGNDSPELEQLNSSLSPEGDGAESKSESNPESKPGPESYPKSESECEESGSFEREYTLRKRVNPPERLILFIQFSIVSPYGM